MLTLDLRSFPRAGYSEDGAEYYAFLRSFVALLPKDYRIVELGTRLGLGSCALASAGHKVDTCDPLPYDQVQLPSNVTFHPVGCLDLPTDLYNHADLIYLDVHLHDGRLEKEWFDKFQTTSTFHGILLADDIHFCKTMHDWWDSLPQPRYDLTDIAHIPYGFGLLNLNPEVSILTQ